MTLKVGFGQAVMPGSNTTVDITDTNAGFASDVKAAVVFSSSASANNTATAHSRFTIGLAANNAGTTQAVATITGADAATPSDETKTNLNNKIHVKSTSLQVADLSSWLSNGIRLNETVSTDTVAFRVNALLLGGDIEAKVLQFDWTAASGNKAVAHGLGGAPELLIAVHGNAAANASGATTGQIAMGFWATGGGQNGYLFEAFHSSNPSSLGGSSLGTAWPMLNGAFGLSTLTVGTVDGTNVNISAATSWTGAVYVLAIRATSGGALTVAAGTFTTPTSVSSVKSISTPSFDPQVVLLWGSLHTSLGTDFTDLSSSISYGCAMTNSGGIGQGSISTDADDALNPTDRNDQTSNTEALKLLAVNGGAADIQAPVTSFTTGVTFNYTNVSANAVQCGYLAFKGAAVKKSPFVGKFGGKFAGKFGDS